MAAAGLVVLAVLAGIVIAITRGPDRALSAAGPGPAGPTPVATGATPSAVPATPPATPTPSATPPGPSKPAAPPPRPPAGRSPKKGVSTWDFTGVGAAMLDVHAAWYYNWSAGPTNGAGTSAEFIPMIWGSGSVTVSTLNKAKAAGTTLLGFNEPDHGEQANLTPAQALDLWPQLQATGLRLGSPAVASGGATAGGWLDQFISGARSRGYRVDFIALHWYGGDFSTAAVGQLRGYLQAVYDRYHLPIWLTEYALMRFGPTTYPSSSQQVAFIQGSTAMLQSLSYVERYAWFALPTSTNGQDATGLYRNGTTPTAAGAAYRAVAA
jgi:hypothetical protein